MTIERSATENAYIARAVEASINIGLVALLAAVCLLILAPFVPIVAWGIIIAVASYPVFLKLQHATGRGGWAAAIWTILLLARADHPGCSAGQQHGGGRPKFNGPPGCRNVCRSASPAQPRGLASYRCSFEPNLEHGLEQLDGGCETPRASDQDFPSKAIFCVCRHRPNRAAILLFDSHCGSTAGEGPKRRRSNARVCQPAFWRARR